MSKGQVIVAGIKHLTETLNGLGIPDEEAERADAYEALVTLRAVARAMMVKLTEGIQLE
jgi:hypothetical protein